MPIGSPRRSIAIILGQPSRQREDDASVALDQRLPFELQASGLSVDNSLIWPFILHKVSPIEQCDVSGMVGLHRHYRETTYSILSASLAKVVLVCGLETYARVSSFDQIHGFSSITSISIQRSQIPMLTQYEGKSIRRISFYLPDFQGLTVSYNWDLYIEKSTIRKMTVYTISENVRRWAYRKGFLGEKFLNEEDILQLQQLSRGSIPQAIRMLFSSIPKSSKKPTFKGKGSRRLSHPGSPRIRVSQRPIRPRGRPPAC